MISLAEASTDLMRTCARHDGRVILAIAGEPGAGKSTAAERVLYDAAAAGISTAVVPMDGWHLAHSTLTRLGQTHVKGAPHTFDAYGFVALVERLRAQRPGDATIWAPEFRREIEDAVAGAVQVDGDVRLVVVEGNYLLLDDAPWRALAPMFDVAWLLTPQPERRIARLIARHEAFGRDAEAARRHALGSDQANADRVRATLSTSRAIEVDPG